MSYINEALEYLHRYPALLAITLGTLASWTGATLLEAVFLPEGWTPRQSKQATVIANLVLGTVISAITWHFLAPRDPRGFRIAVSFTCALVSPFSYVWVARIASHFVPWINSVWQLAPPPSRYAGVEPDQPWPRGSNPLPPDGPKPAPPPNPPRLS